MIVITSLLVLAPFPQTPPCLSTFQRVTPLSAGIADYTIHRVEVDGDSALALGTAPFTTASGTVRIDAFERNPATGVWTAVQSLGLDGSVMSATFNESFELDGDFAIFPRGVGFRQRVTVLVRDSVTGLWSVDDVLPTTSSSIRRVRLSGDRIAVGLESPDRVEIWRRVAGSWALEDTLFPTGVASGFQFIVDFDIEGDRVVSNASGMLDVYRALPSGQWAPESAFPAPTGFWLDAWFEPTFFDGGRWTQLLQTPGTNDRFVGMGFWRVSQDPGPTRAIYDGAVLSQSMPFGLATSDRGALASGTMITSLVPEACGSASLSDAPYAVISTGRSDSPALRGWFCALDAPSTTGNALDIDYDGLTVAAAVRDFGTNATPSIQFASLLGSDRDRDGDCTSDATQIAQQPGLDRNGNGRIDATEVRGQTNCDPQAPNSSGAFASLRVVGSEFTPTTDMTALIDGIPANTVGVLVVARSPLAGTPMGTYGLCLGAGSPGVFGRYPVFGSGAQGAAEVDLPSTQLPGAAHVPGDTWGWQYVYRDGAVFRTSAAVRVTLQ